MGLLDENVLICEVKHRFMNTDMKRETVSGDTRHQ